MLNRNLKTNDLVMAGKNMEAYKQGYIVEIGDNVIVGTNFHNKVMKKWTFV